MVVNIISHTHVLYFLYTLYREGLAIGRVNKEAIYRSIKRPHEGTLWVPVKLTKVSEPPDYLLERINRECLRYWCFRRAAVGIERQLLIMERKVLNNRLSRSYCQVALNIGEVLLLWQRHYAFNYNTNNPYLITAFIVYKILVMKLLSDSWD